MSLTLSFTQSSRWCFCCCGFRCIIFFSGALLFYLISLRSLFIFMYLLRRFSSFQNKHKAFYFYNTISAYYIPKLESITCCLRCTTKAECTLTVAVESFLYFLLFFRGISEWWKREKNNSQHIPLLCWNASEMVKLSKKIERSLSDLWYSNLLTCNRADARAREWKKLK